MRISQLSLTNFRNYSTRGFSFDPEFTLIVGPNGSGKTNILEAIYLVATGRSWRTDDTGDLVQFGAEVGHVHSVVVQATSDKPSSRAQVFDSEVAQTRGAEGRQVTSDIQMTLTRGVVLGKQVAKTTYKLYGAPKRKSDVIGQLTVVLFEPQSLMIVIGDPEHRRRFLDDALCQTDAEYRNDLHIYARALKVRNRLLDVIREGKTQRESLEYWERAMVKHGEKMQEARVQLIDWINRNLASKGRTLQGPTFLELEYDSSPISVERIDLYRDREIAAGFTLIGPQRDDFKLQVTSNKLQARELNSFGSRGEQRMAVLRLKLAEAQWIEEKTGEPSVLLLDDIYSELDDEHDRMVQELVRGRQTIITTTESFSDISRIGNVIKLDMRYN